MSLQNINISRREKLKILNAHSLLSTCPRHWLKNIYQLLNNVHLAYQVKEQLQKEKLY